MDHQPSALDHPIHAPAFMHYGGHADERGYDKTKNPPLWLVVYTSAILIMDAAA